MGKKKDSYSKYVQILTCEFRSIVILDRHYVYHTSFFGKNDFFRRRMFYVAHLSEFDLRATYELINAFIVELTTLNEKDCLFYFPNLSLYKSLFKEWCSFFGKEIKFKSRNNNLCKIIIFTHNKELHLIDSYNLLPEISKFIKKKKKEII